MPTAIIGVMGVEGSGKSSFVKFLSGDERIEIGHSLDSKTSSIRASDPFQVNDRAVALIDTDGFDGHRPGAERRPLEAIASAMKAEERGKIGTREGVIWIHRINDDSPNVITEDTLERLASVCGTRQSPPDLHKVVLVTTLWESVPFERAVQYEAQLRSEGFKLLLDAGVTMERYNGTPESGKKIVSILLKGNSGLSA
ncbi:hypothetical protein OBBRIDRAFT_826306 [Obba rivulosa]|uniref:G domain-containing protein n=1 Tax=Obba rivulosa TaxID=1052685 RepID=A0A8E2DJW7_9APHY|nr:hypothetical protein OBBRIDRAFT_826306 [Obba rivulosa]